MPTTTAVAGDLVGLPVPLVGRAGSSTFDWIGDTGQSSGARWATGSAEVMVSDGRLTFANGAGATACKPNFVILERMPDLPVGDG